LKKLQKPVTDKLDNITEFTQQILNSDKVLKSGANPKNVLAIEEENKNVSKNAEANGLSESDHLLPLPKSPQ
jgi:hypothetical protein